LFIVGAEALPVSRLLCIGAHSDDIEIGCGATVLKLLETHPAMAVDWVVLTANGPREDEARASGERFLADAAARRIMIEHFRERYFPYDGDIKAYFDRLGAESRPDIVLAPSRDDAHQDHRTASELAANTFRDQLILEYEIPKFDGDLGRPGVFVHLSEAFADRKVDALMAGFPSQHDRPWFNDATFRALMRIRGVESKAPEGYAEAFHCRNLVLA
jgi:LmbE family N-acetylglucosaminyl deacetylase